MLTLQPYLLSPLAKGPCQPLNDTDMLAITDKNSLGIWKVIPTCINYLITNLTVLKKNKVLEHSHALSVLPEFLLQTTNGVLTINKQKLSLIDLANNTTKEHINIPVKNYKHLREEHGKYLILTDEENYEIELDPLRIKKTEIKVAVPKPKYYHPEVKGRTLTIRDNKFNAIFFQKEFAETPFIYYVQEKELLYVAVETEIFTVAMKEANIRDALLTLNTDDTPQKRLDNFVASGQWDEAAALLKHNVVDFIPFLRQASSPLQYLDACKLSLESTTNQVILARSIRQWNLEDNEGCSAMFCAFVDIIKSNVTTAASCNLISCFIAGASRLLLSNTEAKTKTNELYDLVMEEMSFAAACSSASGVLSGLLKEDMCIATCDRLWRPRSNWSLRHREQPVKDTYKPAYHVEIIEI
jgi:hypothetical protein